MANDSNNLEDDPWRKPGIAQQVARDLGVPEDTVVFPLTRKPMGKPEKGGISHSMKSKGGKPGRVRSVRKKGFQMPM